MKYHKLLRIKRELTHFTGIRVSDVRPIKATWFLSSSSLLFRHSYYNVYVMANTGSEVCAAGAAFVESMDLMLKALEHTDEVTTTFNGSKSMPLGVLRDVQIVYGGNTVTRTFRIYQELKELIISWKAAKEVGIIRVLPPTVKFIGTNAVEHEAAPLVNPSNSFAEPGDMNFPHGVRKAV